MPNLLELAERRDRAREQFATLGDLRPGTLSENYRKCGKSTCRCAREGDPGHGPSWVLNRTAKGRTGSVRIPVAEIEETRRLVAEYRRFREFSAEFLEASEALAAARHQDRKDGSRETETGGALKRRLRRRSPPKSTG